MKQILIAVGAIALSTGLALAQTSGGTNMGNGTTTRGMNSMSKHYGPPKHHHMMKRVRHQHTAKTCTQEGQRASGPAYHC